MKKNMSKRLFIIFLTFSILLSVLTFPAYAVEILTLRDDSPLSITKLNNVKILIEVSDKVSVNTLISHFINNSKIVVTKNDSIITDSDIVGTGTLVSFNNDKAYVVINGDVDGDGLITSTDYLLVKKYILKTYELTELFIYAADINKSGTIDSTDYLQIKRHLIKMYNLFPIKTTELESSVDSSLEDFISNEDFSEDISQNDSSSNDESTNPSNSILENIPSFSGNPYYVLNNNIPSFSASDLKSFGYEKYSELDSLGRCGVAIASCGTDTMPTEPRESISNVKPSGWIQATYDFISTGSLYNRSHLIAWSLCGENANPKNLITGTSYMNQRTMTKFEDLVRDYINETGNHVAYRVTPIFIGNNLVCNGVQMEAYSVEDNGEGICYNVYCYNVQPGVVINYATGESYPEKTSDSSDENTSTASEYILNTKSKKIHLSTCSSVSSISSANVQKYDGSLDDIISKGYSTCATCIGKISTDTSSDYSSEEPTESTESSVDTPSEDSSESETVTYVLNTKSKRIHLSTCGSVKTILEENKSEYTGSLDSLISQGYLTCGTCIGKITSDTSSDYSSEEPTESTESSVDTPSEDSSESETVTYILNTKSKRIHLSTCGSVKTILEENKSEYTGSLDSLISQGYLTCGTCIGKISTDTSSDYSSEEPTESTESSVDTPSEDSSESETVTYILNTKSKRIHLSTCGSVKTILEENKSEYTGSLDSLISQGYLTCGTCIGKISTDTSSDYSSEEPTESTESSVDTPSEDSSESETVTYILNTKSKRVHLSTCGSVKTILEENKSEYTGSLDDLISQGYKACGSCKPT